MTTTTAGISIGSGGNLFDGKTIALSSMPNGTVITKGKGKSKWAYHTKGKINVPSNIQNKFKLRRK